MALRGTDRMAAARALLEVCLHDAIERFGLGLTAQDHAMVDGAWITVRAHDGAVVCLVDARFVDDDPFDDVLRDRARSVATRLQAPTFAIITFRRAVLYASSAAAARAPEEQQVLLQRRLADVLTLDDVRSDAAAESISVGLRDLLSAAIAAASGQTSETGADDVLLDRLRDTTAELLDCTDRSARQRSAVVRLATSILAYGLVHMRNEEALDRLSIPYGVTSAELMLDIIGAYFRAARRAGHLMVPDHVTDVAVLPHRAGIFRTALADLCRFLQRFDPIRLDDLTLHRAVDAYLAWCAGTRRTAAPTIDLVDVALRMAAPSTDASNHAIRLLEVGSAHGLFAVRSAVLADSRGMAPFQSTVYVADADDERHVVLRTIGQVNDAAGLHMLRSRDAATAPWDVACITASDTSDRHRLRVLIHSLPMASHGALVLVVPLAALHDPLWAGVRAALGERFSVEWIVTSDVQPFSEPDAGLCCILARHDAGDNEPLARLVVLRQPFEAFFVPCHVPRERDAKRVHGIDTFVRYLAASDKGKNNSEAVVRVLPQRILRERATDDAGWFDLAVPVDVLVRILQKAHGKLQVLRDVGSVHNGLRTGANEFFLVDQETIATQSLEPPYWQRTLMTGNLVDNLIVTDADQIKSIMGAPTTDRRLLLIPADHRQIEGSNVRTRIDAAERDGLHTRPSVRQREPWWALGEPVVPDLIVPKRQTDRRLVAMNTAHAFISDVCIGVVLHDNRLTEAMALWMNSTAGLFFDALFRERRHRADVTVRDAEAFPVPVTSLARDVIAARYRIFMRRHIAAVDYEWGVDEPDAARLEDIRKDRRMVDQWFMENMLGLSPEEQRWMLRLLLLWWNGRDNVRYLVSALTQDIEERLKLRPLSTWYSATLEQLPEQYKRSVLIPDGITGATISRTMFAWQVSLLRGTKSDEVIDCQSYEEADIIRLFVELGKRTVEVPLDAPIITELLPQLDRFRTSLDAALDAVCSLLPDTDIRHTVRDMVRARMVEL